MSLDRRALLLASAAAPVVGLGGLAGCTREAGAARYDGSWLGASHERGHLLRSGPPATKSGALPLPALQHRAAVVVVGGGIGGLAAARTLVRAGIDDIALLELEDSAGGNSRGHSIAGLRCPLGAHYLPVPGERATEVIELLEALKLRRTEQGRPVYDERALCHTPQERLFIGGGWHEGLLPPIDALPEAERATALAHYRGFAARVAELGEGQAKGAFAIPTARSAWSPALDALDAQTFAAWLDAQGLTAPALRWYLDYCCRDDYGAGAAQVSAWAGIHYFASRHGFHAPGSDEAKPSSTSNADAGEGLLTWPEGNAWLAERLAAPLAGRSRAGLVVLSVREEGDAAVVDAWNVAAGRLERWRAAQVVLATPLFVAARLVQAPAAALVEAARRMPHAPWLVANLHIAEPLTRQPGAPLSWDNVLYAARALGYVDAQHQSLAPFAGPTVLTAYWPLGGRSPAELAAGRAGLLADDWGTWAGRVVADLAPAHPDLPAKLRRVDLMRYGHAMSVPVPGLRSSAALRALAEPQRRIHFAHADLAAYSVFEEALYHGTRAGRDVAARLAG